MEKKKSNIQYKMKTDQIICCVVALLLGMLLANMLKNVCGCKVVEGMTECTEGESLVYYDAALKEKSFECANILDGIRADPGTSLPQGSPCLKNGDWSMGSPSLLTPEFMDQAWEDRQKECTQARR